MFSCVTYAQRRSLISLWSSTPKRWYGQDLNSFEDFQTFLNKEKVTLDKLKKYLPETPVGGTAGHYASLLFAYKQLYPQYDPISDVAILKQALAIPSFVDIISSPSGIQSREATLDKTFRSLSLQNETVKFLKQLDSIKKLPLLARILPIYESYAERVDPPPVNVKFVVSSEEFLPMVENFIQKAGAKAIVKWSYDPSLRDGMIIETENGQIDASLQNAELLMNQHLQKVENQYANHRNTLFDALL